MYTPATGDLKNTAPTIIFRLICDYVQRNVDFRTPRGTGCQIRQLELQSVGAKVRDSGDRVEIMVRYQILDLSG